MALTAQRLKNISGLKLQGLTEELNGKALEEYCGALKAFSEKSARTEETLTRAFMDGGGDDFPRGLSEFAKELADIHAGELLDECNNLINSAETASRESVEVSLFGFLSHVSVLSESIQAELKETQKIILAVDDIPVQLNMLKLALSGTKYKFVGVTSADACLNYVSRFKPSLFILDIEMPKVNGYELAKKIREAGQWSPIIFLTGNATKESVIKAAEVGAVDFLVKPISDTGLLLEKVTRYLE